MILLVKSLGVLQITSSRPIGLQYSLLFGEVEPPKAWHTFCRWVQQKRGIPPLLPCVNRFQKKSLKAHHTYLARVRCKNAVGWSRFSEVG